MCYVFIETMFNITSSWAFTFIFSNNFSKITNYKKGMEIRVYYASINVFFSYLTTKEGISLSVYNN